jgi:hypothetical protein
MPETVRNQVFLSYSHKDAKWLQRLQVHFSPLEQQAKIHRWYDTMIMAAQNGIRRDRLPLVGLLRDG